MNLQKEIQQIEEAEKGCEVKKALAGALEKVEREFNRTEEKMSKGISDKVAELEARISDIEKKDKKFLPPLVEIRSYGYTNKFFFLGRDISKIATKATLILDGGEAQSLDLSLDLKALANDVYKDKANSGLKMR